MRNLKDVYPDYEGRVAILGIDWDPGESEGRIRQYAEGRGYPWDMAAHVGDVLIDYGIFQQAAAVAINGDGVITYRKGYFGGSLSERDWREVLDEVAG